jgi:hypothetical protein
VLVFRLGKCRFRFLNSPRYTFHKLVGQLQGRPRLLGFKAYARVSSGVDHEGDLLSQRVYRVVVLELACG